MPIADFRSFPSDGVSFGFLPSQRLPTMVRSLQMPTDPIERDHNGPQFNRFSQRRRKRIPKPSLPSRSPRSAWCGPFWTWRVTKWSASDRLPFSRPTGKSVTRQSSICRIKPKSWYRRVICLWWKTKEYSKVKPVRVLCTWTCSSIRLQAVIFPN